MVELCKPKPNSRNLGRFCKEPDADGRDDFIFTKFHQKNYPEKRLTTRLKYICNMKSLIKK